MNTYIIGYDLKRPGQDYETLFKAIKTYGTYWHNLDSTWIIKTERTAAQVRDHLAAHIDNTDRLLVVKSGHEGAWQGFSETASTWLKSNL